MKNPKSKNKSYPPNPNGHYVVDLKIRGITCKVTIMNESFLEYKVEVKAKKELSQEFLNYIAKYMELEGFYDEAQKHNIFWGNTL
jgi:hypothetical protein